MPDTKVYCTYHPTKPALWYCEACDIYLCTSCIQKRDITSYNKKNSMYLCPKCNGVADRLSISNIVDPFWNVLPHFFAYPLAPRVLILMLVLSILMTLFSAPGILSAIFIFVIYSVLVKYSFSILRSTALGRMDPPEINEETISGDISPYIKLICIYFFIVFLFVLIPLIIGASVLVLGLVGVIIIVGCMLLVPFALPAMIIVLATSNSFFQAINPMISVRMALRIGPSYLLMCFFLFLLIGAPGTVAYFARPVLPEIVFAFVSSIVGCYYTIVSFHLMGYVIFQNHELIGYEVDFDDNTRTKHTKGSPSGAEGGLAGRINFLIKEGKLEEAVNLIREKTDGEIMDPDMSERYYNLLKITKQTPDMLAHARLHMENLLEKGDKDKLCEVYMECSALDKAFEPEADTLFKVAKMLDEKGNHSASLGAYNRFIKSFPNHPMTPKAYFVAASIFNEKLNDPQKSLTVLNRLIKSFPHHEIVPYAQKYLRKISG